LQKPTMKQHYFWPVWIELLFSLCKIAYTNNNFLYIIHKFVKVVYEKTIYKNIILANDKLKKKLIQTDITLYNLAKK
jgi:hypothetical protein